MSGLGRNHDFMRLWAAQAVSAVGYRITRTVLPIIAITTIDANAAQVALLAALSFAPGLVVSLFAGGLVDRRAKRPLLIGSDLFRAAILLTVPVAAHFGSLSMAQLYLVAGAVGGATTLFGIADNSFLPAVVAKSDLVSANSRLEASESVAEGIGPWIGGVLVSLIGAPLALVFDAASYLWSALLLGRVTKSGAPIETEAPAAGMFQDAIAGFRTCRAAPLVWRMLWATGLVAFSGGFFFAYYMVVTVDLLSLSPAVVGLIIGFGGLGSFMGALAAGPAERRFGLFNAIVLTLLLAKIWDFAMPLSLVFPEFAVPLLISAQLVGDGFMTISVILALSLRQLLVPEARLGRASASFHLIEGSALVAGALTAGALALFMPVGLVIWGATVGGLVAVAVLWTGRDAKPENAT